MKALVSWARHKLGLNSGTVEAWTRRDGTVMIGYKCECGETHGIHPAVPIVQGWDAAMLKCTRCDKIWVSIKPHGVLMLECPGCGTMNLATNVASPKAGESA